MSLAAAGTLFADGLVSIFAYCDNSAWLQSSRVSPYWFRIASASRCRSIFLVSSHHSTETKECMKEYTRSGFLHNDSSFRYEPFPFPCHSYQSYVPNDSRWTLRHHIDHISHSVLKWTDIHTRFLVRKSSCATLSLATSTSTTAEAEAEATAEAIAPPTTPPTAEKALAEEELQEVVTWTTETDNAWRSAYPALRTLRLYHVGLPPLVSQMQYLTPEALEVGTPMPMPFPTSLTDLTLNIEGGFIPQTHSYADILKSKPRSPWDKEAAAAAAATAAAAAVTSSSLSPLQYLLITIEMNLSAHLQQMTLEFSKFEETSYIDINGSYQLDPSESPRSSTRLDWSPIRSFQQLHSLRVTYNVRKPLRSLWSRPIAPIASRLIPACGQLPLLTDLELCIRDSDGMSSNISPEFSLDDIVHLTRPKLRKCRLPFPLSDLIVVESMHRIQPLIEEFCYVGTTWGGMDVPTIVRLFTNLKYLSFWWGLTSEMSEETVVSAISQAKSLTRLTMISWYPKTVESYVLLGQSSNLTNLTYFYIEDLDPLRLLVQGAALGSQPLITRLRRIDVSEGVNLVTLPSLDLFAHFTSLIELRLDCWRHTIKHPNMYLDVYDRFNNPTFLPRLQIMHVKEGWSSEKMYLSLKYQYNADLYNHGQNECEYTVLESDGITHTKYKKQIRVEHNPMIAPAACYKQSLS